MAFLLLHVRQRYSLLSPIESKKVCILAPHNIHLQLRRYMHNIEALATLYGERIVISMNYYQSGRKIPVDKVVTLGVNQQKDLKFHGILANLLPRKAYRRFSISQILVAYSGVFLRTDKPLASSIFSSKKSYSPCRLK
jgi:hypothetical protein